MQTSYTHLQMSKLYLTFLLVFKAAHPHFQRRVLLSLALRFIFAVIPAVAAATTTTTVCTLHEIETKIHHSV